MVRDDFFVDLDDVGEALFSNETCQFNVVEFAL
jgi:hypothetical protein